MSYVAEEIVKALRDAREVSGMSQRALSAKAGLSQSHISQIESGTLEPGLSKLVDIARALDLELVLVPRKLVPAINSLTTTARPERESPSYALREIDRAERLVKKIRAKSGSSAAIDRMIEAIRFFRYAPIKPADLKIISDGADQLKHTPAGADSASLIQSLAYEWMMLRNRLAHGASEEPRPAYSGEENDDA
jgi:transcriptional regulator with XRE-family HTH domain